MIEMMDLVIKNFKTAIINMLKILNKYMSIMRKEIKTIIELQDLKNTISEIKFSRWLDQTLQTKRSVNWKT